MDAPEISLKAVGPEVWPGQLTDGILSDIVRGPTAPSHELSVRIARDLLRIRRAISGDPDTRL